MKHPAAGDTERIQNLLNKGTENVLLCEFTTYPEINSKTDFNTIATLMLHTGYLTVSEKTKIYGQDERCNTDFFMTELSTQDYTAVKIPNNEVRACFERKAMNIFSLKDPEWLEKAVTLRDLC